MFPLSLKHFCFSAFSWRYVLLRSRDKSIRAEKLPQLSDLRYSIHCLVVYSSVDMEQSCEGTFIAHACIHVPVNCPASTMWLWDGSGTQRAWTNIKKLLGKGLCSCALFSVAWDVSFSAFAVFLSDRVVPVGPGACKPRLLSLPRFQIAL